MSSAKDGCGGQHLPPQLWLLAQPEKAPWVFWVFSRDTSSQQKQYSCYRLAGSDLTGQRLSSRSLIATRGILLCSVVNETFDAMGRSGSLWALGRSSFYKRPAAAVAVTHFVSDPPQPASAIKLTSLHQSSSTAVVVIEFSGVVPVPAAERKGTVRFRFRAC